jgi:hypothetical protein
MSHINKLLFLFFLFGMRISFAQSGCTDYRATNYDLNATVDDGSCIYPYTFMPLTFKCYIDSFSINETSGIVNQEKNFWTHNDDTDNSIYKIDSLSPAIFQRVTINNATNVDWEDISSDSTYIYIEDAGNNGGNRTNLRFFRILKSDLIPSATSVNASKISFTYSDQVDFTANHNHNFYDCEAFFVLNDTIHLFTKGWVNHWTKHYALPADTGVQVAQLVDSFNVNGLITSAAIQGDSLVVLLGLVYNGGNNCFVWMFNKFNGSGFFGGNKRKLYIGSPYSIGQTEGICFTDTNKGYITNEKFVLAQFYIPAQLREFDLNPYLAPRPVPVIDISEDSISHSLAACADSGTANVIIRNTATDSGADLIFSLDSLPLYISSSITGDTLSPGDSTIITFSFVSGTLPGGIYPVNVIINSNDPLQPVSNLVITLNIDSNPCVSFFYFTDTCSGFTYFQSAIMNCPDYVHWDFGDGDTTSSPVTSHTYSSNGIYNVTLIGCWGSRCDTVTQVVPAHLSVTAVADCYPVTSAWCCGAGITHFQLTGSTGDVINKSSNDGAWGFEDFSCVISGVLFTNNIYSLNCTTGNSYSEFLKVWLDMNNDGMLDTLTEELYSGYDSILHSGNLYIPANAGNVYGVPIRLRVSSDLQPAPSPCVNQVYGQTEDYSVILNFSTGIANVSNENDLNVFPNPFYNSTSIEYAISQISNVRLEVFNVVGESVCIFVDSQMPPGQYHYQFKEETPGIYFVKLSVNDKVVVKRVMKLK